MGREKGSGSKDKRRERKGGFTVGVMSSDVCKSGVNPQNYLRSAISCLIDPFYSTTAFQFILRNNTMRMLL